MFSDLKQVLWALFLVYLILLSTGYLFGRQIGHTFSFQMILTVAALVTVTFISIYLFNLIWNLIEEVIEKRLHKRNKGR